MIVTCRLVGGVDGAVQYEAWLMNSRLGSVPSLGFGSIGSIGSLLAQV